MAQKQPWINESVHLNIDKWNKGDVSQITNQQEALDSEQVGVIHSWEGRSRSEENSGPNIPPKLSAMEVRPEENRYWGKKQSEILLVGFL